jgi:hypothetical protein
MKKFIFTLAVLATVMFALPSQAQIKFGVKGGVNLNKATFSTSDLDSKNYTGFFIGPMVMLQFLLWALALTVPFCIHKKVLMRISLIQAMF